MKNSELSILFTFGMLIFLLLSTGVFNNQLYSQIPEPNCVCAECNKKCGTGHETTCSSYSKKSSDGYKDINEKSISEIASLDGFEIFTDNGKILKVSNNNNFEVIYSFEFELTDKDQIISILCNNYTIKPNTLSINLFTATENAILTKILLTEVFKK